MSEIFGSSLLAFETPACWQLDTSGSGRDHFIVFLEFVEIDYFRKTSLIPLERAFSCILVDLFSLPYGLQALMISGRGQPCDNVSMAFQATDGKSSEIDHMKLARCSYRSNYYVEINESHGVCGVTFEA